MLHQDELRDGCDTAQRPEAETDGAQQIGFLNSSYGRDPRTQHRYAEAAPVEPPAPAAREQPFSPVHMHPPF